MYAKNTGRLQERLDVYWIVHNFVRVHLSLFRFLSAMMRLSPHHTVTGGTTHGRCTVH
jgi:hypothetical protein